MRAALFEGSKNKSKVLAAGLHLIPFNLPPVPKEYPPSMNGTHISCEYFLETMLELKSKKVEKNETSFTVVPLPLDNNPAALEWQSKSGSKFLKMSLKKLSVEVTVPTGISRREYVPILLFISNDSNNPTKIIRSRLICSIRADYFRTGVIESETICNEYVEEVNATNCGVTHYLKVRTAGVSYSCPHATEKYRIEVEVESSKKSLKFEFPVIVGEWKNKPARKENPFGLLTGDFYQEEEPVRNSSSGKVVEFASANVTNASLGTSDPPSYETVIQAPPLPSKSSLPRHTFYTAKALYSFNAAHPSEISFEIGEIITNVHESDEDGWLVGTLNGKTGLIPARYVEPVSDQVINSL
ncbi:unnamed protein product [Caenorhabditis brenneri]